MNIIDERNIRTIHRKMKKAEYDSMIQLAVPTEGQTVRLLDEGMVVDSGGYPWFYIMKGTLDKYMAALPDDYEGSINLGHMDFAHFPFILGKWNKSDLSLVDIGDGRKALDVNLRLDNESFLVKELRRMDYDMGVSAEFTFNIDSELSDQYGIEMIDEVFIKDFAIVGEAGNVNSSGIQLKTKGDGTVTESEFKTFLSSLKKKDEVTDLKTLNALMEEAITSNQEEVAETETEEASEEIAETEEVAEETAETTEETSEEVAEETAEETPKEGETMTLAVIADMIKDLREENANLREQLAQVQGQLAAKEASEREFVDKFKNLSVSIREEQKPVVKTPSKIGMTNGIGEL